MWLNEVLVWNKKTLSHIPKQIFRQYLSFGKIPEFDPKHAKSYMFHGSKKQDLQDIPKEYRKYIESIKALDSRYNQFVINYYRDGEDYIEPHSDCDKHMIDDYKILILSLGETRTLRLTSRVHTIKGSLEIILKDQDIFVLDKFLNTKFRHEILKDDSKNPRISITARMMK